MSTRHPVGPRLDLVTRHLDSETARTAHEMVMMVSGSALAVDGLSVRADQSVDLSGGGQILEFPIDGGQSDPAPGLP